MQKVASDICYLLVFFSEANPLLIRIFRTFLFTGKSTLLTNESFLVFAIGLWISDCVTVAVSIEFLNPDINADCATIIRKSSICNLNTKRDIILSTCRS